MVCQALFLFRDVEFLDVVDKLLLQTVLVIIDGEELFELLCDALAYLLRARLLVLLQFFLQPLYVVYLLSEFLLQRRALLLAEVN